MTACKMGYCPQKQASVVIVLAVLALQCYTGSIGLSGFTQIKGRNYLMTYQVLYRVWRPQGFEELAGQEHIRRTLENAILQDRISHAYLFTGPRGTGKTSTARILAKALNCTNRNGAHPCGECESCQTITRGNALDVLEIDGASNRGIEEIRELKEKISFLPALGKYKVYIVDEVHMLTNEAFNALLKTLEEPPAHVIFVLATTDPQKLPPTVLSRCQRFDFRKISYEAIKGRLEEIIAGQERKVDPEALSLIIRQADGGLRDAISLLDQCLSFSPDRLTLDDTCAILGLVRQEALASLLTAVIDGEATELFMELEALFTQGVDPMQLLKEFAGYCRDLLLLALCGQGTELVIAAGQQRRLMVEQSGKLGASRLQQILTRLDQGVAGGRYRGNSRYMAEALFAGLLLDQPGQEGQAWLAGAQPGGLRQSGSQSQFGGQGSSGGQRERASQAPSARPAMPAPDFSKTQERPPWEEAQFSSQPDSGPRDGVGSRRTASASESESQRATAFSASAEAAPAAAKTKAPVAPTEASAKEQPPIKAALGLKAAGGLNSTAAGSSSGGDLSASQWEQILQLIKGQKIVLHAFLLAALRQELTSGVLRIFFDPDKGRFHRDRCVERDNLQMIKDAACQVLGGGLEVECGFWDKEEDTDPIQKAIEIFGSDIVKLSE